jgi:hypothetical protein
MDNGLMDNSLISKSITIFQKVFVLKTLSIISFSIIN